jgi:hypothetical protein
MYIDRPRMHFENPTQHETCLVTHYLDSWHGRRRAVTRNKKEGGGALKKGGGRKGKGLVWGGFDKYPTKESLEASLLLRLLHFPL